MGSCFLHNIGLSLGAQLIGMFEGKGENEHYWFDDRVQLCPGVFRNGLAMVHVQSTSLCGRQSDYG